VGVGECRFLTSTGVSLKRKKEKIEERGENRKNTGGGKRGGSEDGEKGRRGGGWGGHVTDNRDKNF